MEYWMMKKDSMHIMEFTQMPLYPLSIDFIANVMAHHRLKVELISFGSYHVNRITGTKYKFFSLNGRAEEIAQYYMIKIYWCHFWFWRPTLTFDWIDNLSPSIQWIAGRCLKMFTWCNGWVNNLNEMVMVIYGPMQVDHDLFCLIFYFYQVQAVDNRCPLL